LTNAHCLRPALYGDDKEIVGDQEGETGQRQFEVAQIELPGAEPDDEDDYYDLDDGQDSFHSFRSLPSLWFLPGTSCLRSCISGMQALSCIADH